MDSDWVERFKFELEFDRYVGWRILRRNSVGQGWEVATFKTLPAAQHALAGLRFAATLDGCHLDG